MMKELRFLIMLALMVSFGAAHSFQRETRNVEDFDEISLGVSGRLYLSIGDEFKVELDGDEDDLDEIDTDVVNGVLRIRHDGKWDWNWNSGGVKIYVTMPEVKGLSVSGSGTIYAEDLIKTDDIELSVSGSGDLEAEIEAGRVELSISGSGGAELQGTARNFGVRISGSGSLDAYDLRSEDCDVRISGSGSAKVNVSGDLDARISGSGSVYYDGDPDHVNSSASGSGKVRKRG